MRNFRTIMKEDQALNDEVHTLIESGRNLPIARRNNVSNPKVTRAMIGPHTESALTEAMVILHLRPVLLIRNNRIEPPDSQELRRRLAPCLPKLESRIPSVGRIEIHNVGKPYEGTGWLVSDNVIITNRHVAKSIAEKKGSTITFLSNQVGDIVTAFIDFKEEYVNKDVARPEFELAIEKVLFMEDDGIKIPDIAFMQIQNHPKCPAPIPLNTSPIKEKQFVSVIGYPAYDPNGIISLGAARKIFKGIYDVKRCAPGEVQKGPENEWYFFHDCTTLGGNSGSAVLDNQTGDAVGLHFMGEVKKENYAIKSETIVKYLSKMDTKVYVRSATPSDPGIAPEHGAIPEGRPEDYEDREGYQSDFLGAHDSVPLPLIQKGAEYVASFPSDGKTKQILDYEHFSVVLNKDRRMCFYSACNIDGSQSKRGVKRVTWKYDPRIPREWQIKDECYGNPPKFSRGHMTRKEDPIWGSLSIAKVACSDTFHVTNAVPQTQPFNSPMWLALEDYALENARQDDMKISVFTGPIFCNDDPVKHGVRIPLEFYKVIAFVHDNTQELCATGYTVSQADSLSNEEFVFGEFKTYQVSIQSIETKTGISFGDLSKLDPIKGEEGMASVLTSAEDIRFV